MIHLGDITKISGYDVPPVDVVIGGSPCQDLSIAGKREGLAGARSGLFMEQIRLIKEMRDADRLRGRTGQLVRPRYMVWENVHGAFSSGKPKKGEDFRAVLEETIRIAEPGAPDVPLPEKGKWPLADAWYGDGWSVAYRVLDAQFWGVPQRRRRIALVADFGGRSAPWILFERKSLSWDTPEGGKTGETAAAGVGRDTDTAVTARIRCGCEGGGKGALIQRERSGTLSCNNDQVLFCLNDQGSKAGNVRYREELSPTLGTDHAPAVFDARGNGNGEIVPTLTGDHENRVTDYTAIVVTSPEKAANTVLNMTPGENQTRRIYSDGGVMSALVAREKSGQDQRAVLHKQRVRRFTPMECERLQGYPDGWTDIGEWADSKGKKHRTSDAARYVALGNSIALPPWKWVLKRLCAMYERDATMASLFDGIGGFPLIWERLNGPGTCLWASEIEEFPIAVTKRRFGNEEDSKCCASILRGKSDSNSDVEAEKGGCK